MSGPDWNDNAGWQDENVEAMWGDEDIPLCPSCLHPTRPGAHFCHTCLAPLTFYAGVGHVQYAGAWVEAGFGTYESIWAWPWILWRASRTPWPRKLHVWAAWLLLLPWAATPFVWPGVLFGENDGDGWVIASIALIWLPIYATLLWRTTANYLRRRDVVPWPEEE